MRAGREATCLSLLCAATITVLDAVLLELQRGFFTGGFLAQDTATAWSDRAVFLIGSVCLDLVWAVLGVLLALVVAGALGWGRIARRSLALLAGAGPLAIASLVEYQVLARLGDAFDLGLMFDLVGRKPGELLAVSWAHLIAPVSLIVVAVVSSAWALRWINRRFPGGHLAISGWRALGVWCACAIVLTTFTTMVRLRSDVQDNGLRRKPAGQAIGGLVTFASDFDRDGYGLLSRPGDPAPFDARVYPYAVDVPGNGIDEDGVGGDLPVDDSPQASRRAPVFVRKPPVIVVMLETFRADLLGATENGREVTPVLNGMRSAGAAAMHAYSHNGYTVQSRYHLFTGALGRGAQGSLLDDFATNGYETAYFSGQDESFGGPTFDVGTARADHFYDARQDRDRRYTTFTTAGSLGVSSDVVLERVRAYLGTRDPERPLFLYVNFYDTHFPYDHKQVASLVSSVRVAQRDIVASRAEDVRRMYRNTAANVDKAIETLRDVVRAQTRQEPAVIVLADHGESLFEEGFLGHGYVLNDVQTRIPLVTTGIALDLCEPVGQVDLRGAIANALARPDAGDRSTFRACAGHAVFQYLGTLARPRQIAHTTASRRLTYDLREHRVRVDDGSWMHVVDLDERLRSEWLALVHQWERLRASDAEAQEDPS